MPDWILRVGLGVAYFIGMVLCHRLRLHLIKTAWIDPKKVREQEKSSDPWDPHFMKMLFWPVWLLGFGITHLFGLASGVRPNANPLEAVEEAVYQGEVYLAHGGKDIPEASKRLPIPHTNEEPR